MVSDSFRKVAQVILWAAFAFMVAFTAWAAREYLGQPGLTNAVLYPGSMRELPEFELTDSDDRAFDKARLSGKWNFVFFGYTRCPDICPMTLQTMQGIAEHLEGEDAARFIFVSVDPERDDTRQLKSYVKYFNPDFLALSGPHRELKKLTRAMDASYNRYRLPEVPGFDYINHSASIYLVSPDARLYALLPAPHDARTVAADFRAIRRHYRQAGS